MDPFLKAVIGEYRVTGYIGEGGMGRVYRAVHTRLDRVVAVKILTAAAGDTVFMQRFRNEAQIQSRMRDAGVAALYDFTEFRGSPVIIMEYIDGETIQQITERQGAWTKEQAVPVLCSCARTLQYVHSQGIVHRDLKSANVKVSSTGDVKLLDFGIATGTSMQRLTVAGFVIGTFQSLSPEQTRGEQATIASDIWAFGVLAYEMLTASLPFEASNAAELFSKIARASFTAPTVLKPGLGSQIEAVICRCLKREPKERYASMSELLADLQRVPISGDKRKSQIHTAWPQKQLLAIAVAAVALVLLAYGVTVYVTRDQTTSPPPQPAVVTPVAPTSSDQPLEAVTIDTFEGPAEVWQNGAKLGSTPYKFQLPHGQRVGVVLKRPGFDDLPIAFDVGERSSYEYALQRSTTP
jgi:serine/threonine protein kinase